MATREEVRRILNSHRGELSQLGVERLSLFGSVARGDDKPESDVDVDLATPAMVRRIRANLDEEPIFA